VLISSHFSFHSWLHLLWCVQWIQKHYIILFVYLTELACAFCDQIRTKRVSLEIKISRCALTPPMIYRQWAKSGYATSTYGHRHAGWRGEISELISISQNGWEWESLPGRCEFLEHVHTPTLIGIIVNRIFNIDKILWYLFFLTWPGYKMESKEHE